MRIKRAVKIILLCALLFVLLLAWKQAGKNKFLEVSFLDVGQGDASLIELPAGKNILIDGGPDNLILNRLGEELPPFRRKINFIVISHFHDDHIIGLISVLERYRVEKIIFATNLNKHTLGEYLLAKARVQQVALLEIENKANLKLNNNCNLLFINPLSLGVKEDSNNSLIVKLTCKQHTFLFSGDNEKEVEESLLFSDNDLSATIFKASHHGSKTSNQENFLRMVNPQSIVVPVGINNRFNHPSSEFLEIADFLKIKILRTDELGTVKFKVNLANIK